MKILLVLLGCDKNRVDAEVMLGKLRDHGHTFTDDKEQAEAVIVNTCCFIDAAKEESINEILSYAEEKKNGRIRALVVTGCLAQRYRDEIIREIPEVDAVVGVTAADQIAEVLEKAAQADKADGMILMGPVDPPCGGGDRVITTGGSYEYLKIAEGCDKHCTYCVIPQVRGRYRSRPMEELVAEAEKLADAGVSELILVAQETTLYGVDLYGEKRLPMLLEKLCAIEGLHWIRLLYCYPEEIDEALIDTIAGQDKICRYLDIPIQSGSNSVLKRMGRRIDREGIIRLIQELRERIPGIAVRTSLISGFPGETAADHRETMELVKQLRFERLGVFTYSQEEGTPAAKLPDQVPEPLKKRRQGQLMRLQQTITAERSEALQGSVVEAVIEGRITGDDMIEEDTAVYAARCAFDIPEVDGYLFIEGVDPSVELYTGSFVRVRITGASGYDLTGVLYEDESGQ